MLKEKLLEDLKNSMKEKNEIRKNTITLIRAAILQYEKDKQVEITEDQILEIIAKEGKKRKDSLVEYEKAGRQDIINQIKEEIAIIKEYLPEELDEVELTKIIKEIITKTGATSMKDMGIVMKNAKEEIGTKSDGKTINEIVKKLLA